MINPIILIITLDDISSSEQDPIYQSQNFTGYIPHKDDQFKLGKSQYKVTVRSFDFEKNSCILICKCLYSPA